MVVAKRYNLFVLGPRLNCIGGVSHVIKELLQSPLKDRFRLFHIKTGSKVYPFREPILLSLWRLIFSSFTLIFYSLKHKPELIHIHTSLNDNSFRRDAFLVTISRILGKKIVLQCHGGRLDELHRRAGSFLKRQIRKTFQRSQIVIVLSKVQQEPFRKLFPEVEVRVMPNPLEVSQFRDDRQLIRKSVIEQYRLPSVDYYLLFISNFQVVKGIYTTADAVPLIIEKMENVHFIFVGSGPDEKDLRAYCNKLHLNDWVTFTGALPFEEAQRFYQMADLLLFPTHHQEGLSMVVLNAFAAGLPMITCRNGAIAEYVTDGENGLLIEPKRADLLAKAALTLLQKPELIVIMRQNNRKLAETSFDTKLVADKFTDLYLEAINSSL